MTDQTAEWPRERRKLPDQLVAEAAAHPGGSVAETDGSIISDPNGYVPAEAIIGCFLAGADGTYQPVWGHGAYSGHDSPWECGWAVRH